jgi:hypothetical protein
MQTTDKQIFVRIENAGGLSLFFADKFFKYRQSVYHKILCFSCRKLLLNLRQEINN